MGASNIQFYLDGKASRSQIEQQFKQKQQEDEGDADEDGYGGGFSTVRKVDYSYFHQVFNSENEAFDFCMQKAEKFYSVVAVVYKDTSAVTSLPLRKNQEKLRVLRQKWVLEKAEKTLVAKLEKKILQQKAALVKKYEAKGKLPLKTIVAGWDSH